MNNQLIQKKFSDIGANVSITERRPPRFGDNQLVSIDVIENKKGERFVLENPDGGKGDRQIIIQ